MCVGGGLFWGILEWKVRAPVALKKAIFWTSPVSMRGMVLDDVPPHDAKLGPLEGVQAGMLIVAKKAD